MKTGCKLLFLLVVVLTSCHHTPKDRIIPFEGIENGRELGGLVMQDGRSIRWGKLVRTGNLALATDQDVAILKDRFHLSDIYDFRFDAEVAGAPDREMEGVSTENFQSTLDLIDSQYGNLPAYLERALGFTVQDQEKLREKYLK